ncbi:MAG: TIGR02266 family protein, partial [Deltaproteobacteria bacterium]|nr:TIGR02266 family protein [Deltaproteobacteria bacterium]
MSKATQSQTSTPARASDRRELARKAFDIQVGIATDHRLFVGLVSNISAGGLFIATDEHLRMGDQVEVRFSIPGHAHIFDKQATVMWTRPLSEGSNQRTKAGAGVRFSDLTDEETKMLNAFLQIHEPIFFDT